MKKRFLTSVGAWLTGAALACGQTPGQPAALPIATVNSEAVRIEIPAIADRPREQQDLVIETRPVPEPEALPIASPAPVRSEGKEPADPSLAELCGPCCGLEDCLNPRPPRTNLWASTDYLLWWVKHGPLGAPLVTMNPDAVNTTAAVNQPGTAVLLGAGGNSSMNYGNFSGIRATLGAWLDPQGIFGLEGSGFVLERRSVGFGTGTLGPTDGILGIPFVATEPFAGNPAGESTLNAGGTPTLIQFQTTSQLWGAEANGLANLLQTRQVQWAMLLGFRYLDLQEGLQLQTSFLDFLGGGGGVFSVTDRFATRNQFYGGQVGTRLGLTLGQLTVLGTAKVALGPTHEVLYVNGNTAVLNNAFGLPTGTYPGGLFAQPTNSGRFKSDAFTVVPELQGQIGWDLTPNLRVYAGYNFLYASNWLRPGNQIDRNINPSQVPTNFLVAGTSGALVGPPAPVPLMNRSDFWVHGVNWGLQWSF